MSPARIRVGVIANNDRTAAELLAYFAKVNIDAHRCTELGESTEIDPDTALQAMVIFPDDFEAEVVDRLLAPLGQRAPALLQLIVTRQPQRFVASADAPRLVMPRPTFGWVILDAIRAHLDSLLPQES